MTFPSRLLFFAVLALMGALMPLAGLLAEEGLQAEGEEREPRLVLVSTIKGAIGPATFKQIEEAIAEAGDRNAEALVLRIDTPGGLVTSTRDIVSAILASDVPVAGYVWPSGGHVASAGTFIVYSTGIAAMAPGTNIGAATPVMMGGGLSGAPQQPPARPAPADTGEGTPSNEEALSKKATNDAVALIKSLADTHGRNAEWAEEAVREGSSLSAREAQEQGVVEIVASDIDSLLAQMDGREVVTASGTKVLATAGANVEHVEPGFMVELLALISNPNVAFLLMMIGVYGIIFELSNPGTFGPGILGAICLLLGLYALNQLPLDYAGVALIVLGLTLMAVEAFTPTFGVAGFGGLIAFILGASMLVDSENPDFQISWWTIAGTAIASTAVLVFLLGYTLKAMRRPVATGAEEMTGAEARVLEWAQGEGYVHIHGERWHARGPAELAPQSTVRVERLDGLTLIVR
ncbi:MAG: nodulation protein NfeD [Alphaproteobacteria bacterium]|nr:nodulation protein NfeD [Alphaproteobacteria bacterium]MDX5416913.1 nodulation protein NfeD [Alphaproteobacteria bacterium]MDX5494311.1 nodulation protein NfeD [Alphaproteobacteria bacterium]